LEGVCHFHLDEHVAAPAPTDGAAKNGRGARSGWHHKIPSRPVAADERMELLFARR